MSRAEAHLHEFLSALGPAPAKRIDFLTALAGEPPPSLERLYWIARVTLLSRIEDAGRFDAIFSAYFADGALPVVEPVEDEAGAAQAPNRSEGELDTADWAEGSGKNASRLDLRHAREFDAGDASSALVAELTRALPRVGARRLQPARRGRLDLRRSLRDPVELRWRDRLSRIRRVAALIDVSGSQREHSADYLRFGHALLSTVDRGEVFTFGTRLTRVTEPLARSAQIELADADGGTSIGSALQALLDDSRHVARVRGALVVVLSDGLERGDPLPMARAVERLRRLAYRLIWWTPLGRDPSYRPLTRGIQAILPSLDSLAGAHDLPTLLDEVRRIPATCAGPRRRAAKEWQ